MKNIISCKFNMGCLELLLGDPHLIECIAFCVEICDNKNIIINLLSTEVKDGVYIFDENQRYITSGQCSPSERS
ncbi:hypothetical protein SDC9_117096 [bioreactor metagenome]|uniref:Uncharacterized protein n=1 Tax=bioreactor metagenome TaxID=1076179 RepID=A0A645C467_9ZZZZ